MKFFLFILLLTGVNSGLSAQGKISIDQTTGVVSNFNAVYRFSGSYEYDYDLKTYSKVARVNSIIAIQIDETGTGRLIIKVLDKTVLDIEDCVLEDERFSFTLVNRNGFKISAFLIIKDSRVISFWLNRSSDNTALVLYNPSASR